MKKRSNTFSSFKLLIKKAVFIALAMITVFFVSCSHFKLGELTVKDVEYSSTEKNTNGGQHEN